MQFVRVEVTEGRAYTYKFDGTPPLKKGEMVVMPANIVQDREFTGRVIRLLDEPDTDFPLKLVRRAGKAPKAPKLSAEDLDLL